MPVDENIPADGKETSDKVAHILEDFWCRLMAVRAGDMLVGALLPSDKYINDLLISLDIGYNVLTKLDAWIDTGCLEGRTCEHACEHPAETPTPTPTPMIWFADIR